MILPWFPISLEIAGLAAALVSGVFLTFSDFVMPSLAAARPAGGIQSMQIINRMVMRTLFMLLLIGMIPVSVVLIGYASSFLAGPASTLIIAGGATYLVGVLGVSVIFNIPMNKRLDGMDYATDQTGTYWVGYVSRWSFWNSARALSSGLTAACLLTAALLLVQAG